MKLKVTIGLSFLLFLAIIGGCKKKIAGAGGKNSISGTVFFKNGLSDDDFDNSKHLNELLIKSELHNTKIPFRSYKMEGIKKIEEVNFKKEVLKSYYK